MPPVVDIWHVSAASPALDLDGLAGVLSTEESARADRYRFEHDRRQFIVARGILRCLLGRYLGVAPREIPLTFGPQGKPGVEGPLQFNLAHSRGFVAFAMVPGRRVGIDVEKINPTIDVLELATGFFSQPETESLQRLQGGERVRAFFRCWSRKEAYLKAIGDGLSRPLGDFDVATDLRPGSLLLDVRWDRAEVARWHLADIALDPGYTSALAVEGGEIPVRVRPVTDLVL
jgi:4'-phosphopantetheinyl transferase